MAFVRSWAEGVDVLQAWRRYGAADDSHAADAASVDGRRARGELQRLRLALQALARAHGRADLVALLRRDPESIASGGPELPTLEDFRATQPADFYSEAELIELYRGAYPEAAAGASAYAARPAHPARRPSASHARRRQRLRERLVLAVQWLDRQVARDPQPVDRIEAWHGDKLAQRLAVVGVRTLAELMLWMRLKGRHWHRHVPRLGAVGAAQLASWLRMHTASLGELPELEPPGRRALSQGRTRAHSSDHTRDQTGDPDAGSAAAPAAPRRTALLPLERFAPPAGLDGSAGGNRAPHARCKLSAESSATDYDAIHAWLRLRVPGGHTWRAYRKEAERFLLWAVLERGKALSSLDGDDCVAYREFLAKPAPSWTGPRHVPRWSEAWRPFEGSLSPRSAAAAITIVRGLCGWLVRRHYLDSNPWDDVPARPDAPSLPQLRALSRKQWALVQAWLQRQPTSPAQRRLAFVMRFGYLTGLRLAELCSVTLDQLRHEQLDDGEWAWSLMVLGKRQKWREVPLPDAAVDALQVYLADRDLSLAELAGEPGATAGQPGRTAGPAARAPLIGRLDPKEVGGRMGGGEAGRSLSPARLYDVLAGAFERCAAEVYRADPKAAEWIRQASPHWLRHTHGSHAAANGVPLDVLQANLGHESPATTAIYVRAEKAHRHRAVQAGFAGEGKAA